MRDKISTMKYLLAFVSVLLFISCGGDTENTMTVMGKVKGLKKGTLYLQHIPDSTLIAIDSMQVDDEGNFTFKTEVESPEIFYLYLDKKDNNTINDRITFFGEPGVVTINTAWNTFDTKATIEGSSSHQKLEEYKDMMSKFNTRGLEYVQVASTPEIQGDSIALDSLQQLSDKNVLSSYRYALNFALNNKDSYVAPYIALSEVADANVKYLDSIHNSLTPEVANSKYGLALKEYLDTIERTN